VVMPITSAVRNCPENPFGTESESSMAGNS